jgi:predicted permease
VFHANATSGLWLDALHRDVRLGARMLRKHAVVTGAATVSLSLALGACLVAFSLVDALILRPLPVRAPEQLFYLAFPTYTPERPEADTFNDPTFQRLRDASHGHADLAAISTQVIRPVIFKGGGGEKENLRTQFVSGTAFDMFGVAPAAGRLLTSQDDERIGGHPVAVVSYAFWKRRFGGDAAVIGQTFVLLERPYEIVGVTEARFTGVEPGRPTDVWLPYAMYNPRAFGNAQFNWFRIMGRVNPDRRPDTERVLQSTFTNARRDFALRMFGPETSPANIARFVNAPLHVRSASNGPSPLRRQFERPMWILTAIAALVLLIAGSNVANLLLARTAAREREMSLRLSVGAGRGRLIQQILVESALLAAIACIAGVLFANLAGPAIVGMLTTAGDPIHLDLGLDWRLAAVAVTLTLVIIAAFGLAPAWRASGTEPMAVLRTGGPRASARTSFVRPVVAIQVGFSVIALFVGTLLALSFTRLSSVNPGFATSGVLLLSIETVRPADLSQQRAALLQVLDRLRSVPGVEAAGSAEYHLLGRAWTHNVQMPGRQFESIESTMMPVTPGFFEAMRIPLLAGRIFDRQDIESPAPTALIVNDTFARRYFDREPAVGRTLQGRFDDGVATHQIVGIVADTRHDLRKAPEPMLYIPMRLRSNGTIHVRASGDQAALTARLRDEVRGASPLFRVTSVTTQAAVVEQTLLRDRLLAMLSGFFAAVGLVLTAVGLYGVLSYSTVQRTREIGIRMALGAPRLMVVRAVLADAAVTTLAGAAGGLTAGMFLSRFVRTLLFEVTPMDVSSVALPLAALLLSASLAAVLPALRAARIDPMVALRHE